MTLGPLIRPRALCPGDTIAIVSPCGPVTPDHLTFAEDTLASWGFRTTRDRDVLARTDPGYLAGSDAERANALMRAFADPEVDAILCARGGYGAMRILELLDPWVIRSNPKLLIGFSDVTALHLYLAHTVGLASLHGPVAKSFRLHDERTAGAPDDVRSLEHLRRALLGARGAFSLETLRTVRPGEAQGPLYGGNLSLLAAMLSSAHCPDLSGAVVLLEEVGESDYRLDRLLTQVRTSERARGLGGIVLGEFTECAGAYVHEDGIDAFVDALAAEFGCPVVAGLPVGHGPRNVAVPMGLTAHLDATKGAVHIKEDTCSLGESR
ncbi:MAG: LD-carboxypeptidase [Myxococcota bacterium]